MLSVSHNAGLDNLSVECGPFLSTERYSQLRLSRISGDLTNHFDLDEIRVTVLYTFVCLG